MQNSRFLIIFVVQQVLKRKNVEFKAKIDECNELLVVAKDNALKFEEESREWREKAAIYKELVARGHRVGEKRASICVPPSNEALIQTQQQLQRERALNIELKEKNQHLEEKLHKAELNYNKKFEEAERLWVEKSTNRENEYHLKIAYLEEKILLDKETLIKVTNFQAFKFFHNFISFY